MIKRYMYAEMDAIWSKENRLQKWLDAGIAALHALAKYGYIPKNILAQVEKKAKSVNIANESTRHALAPHLRVVQDLLGLSNISTTQIHALVSRDRLRKVHNQFHPHG